MCYRNFFYIEVLYFPFKLSSEESNEKYKMLFSKWKRFAASSLNINIFPSLYFSYWNLCTGRQT